MLIQQSLIEVSTDNHASVEIFNQENSTNLGRIGTIRGSGSNSAFPHIVGCIWFGIAPEPTHSSYLVQVIEFVNLPSSKLWFSSPETIDTGHGCNVVAVTEHPASHPWLQLELEVRSVVGDVVGTRAEEVCAREGVGIVVNHLPCFGILPGHVEGGASTVNLGRIIWLGQGAW